MKSNKLDFDNWVTQKALASELNVTVQCVHNWIKRGKIKSMKITGSRLTLVDKRTVGNTVNK